MMYNFYATTNIGLEDISAYEIGKVLGRNVKPGHGIIEFKGSLEDIVKVNLSGRTIHKLILLLEKSHFYTLNDIYNIAKNLDYTWCISKDQTFAVRTERIGKHNFTSIDVSSIVGKAIIDSYMSAKRIRLKVNLSNPDVEIFCRVRFNEFYIGVNTTGESMHKRNYRVYNHPAALRTTIAASMILMSNWRRDKILMDPMCGGGTIPIEAALMARNMPPGIFRRHYSFYKLKFMNDIPIKTIINELQSNLNNNIYPIYAGDISNKHIEGAKRNAKSADVLDTIKFMICDAMKLEEYGIAPDFVIVNPPYGLRLSRYEYVDKRLYPNFLKALKKVASGGVLVIISNRYKRLSELFKELGYEILEEKFVMHGNLPGKIFKCRIP